MIARRHALSAFAALSLLAAAPFALAADPAPSAKVPAIPAYVQKAVDSPDRPEADKKRDAGRKPAEVFALSGIKPGDHVIEIAAFGQYDTRIMANIVGPNGHIYMYDLPYQEARQTAPTKAFTDSHPNTNHVFGKFDELSFPKDVDLITIDMYYHDLGLNKIDQTVFNKQMFDALRPGGRVLIVDHNATPGSGRTTTPTLHRIDPTLPPAEMEAAGFKMVVNSSMFANPNDDKTKRVFEPTERGSTDRSVWVFEKPMSAAKGKKTAAKKAA